MRFLVLAAAALTIISPASAQTGATKIKTGSTLRTSDMGRLGQVDRVNADGSVQIIFRSKFVTIPASTLTVSEGGEVTTSLTKQEVAKIR